MKKVLTVFLALSMALVLGLTAFADLMPPVFYSVTVGEKPIRRYTIEYKSDDLRDERPDSLVEDGVFRPGERIDVTAVVVINGQKYGAYTTFNDEDEPITNQYGVRMNMWKTYYFLLDDVVDPSDASAAKNIPSPSREMELRVVTQSETTTVTTTRPQPETTTVTTTRPQPDTTTAPDTQTTETATQTETESETTAAAQTVPQSQAPSASETTARTQTRSGSRNSTLRKTVIVCLIAAIILTLTAAVTLALIRRKRNK